MAGIAGVAAECPQWVDSVEKLDSASK